MDFESITKKISEIPRVWIGCGGMAVVFLFLFMYVYGNINGLRNEAVQQENALNAQYQSNQNYLSTYISGFYEQLGLADHKSDKINKILTDAVKGRYGDDGFSANGAFFSAITEAYPDVKGLDIYDDIAEYVRGQRDGYRNIQDKLLDMLRSYDTWRQEGIFKSFIVKSLLGVPSERLVARIGTETWKGKEAEEKMFQIVLASQAKDAYKSGTMEPLKVK